MSLPLTPDPKFVRESQIEEFRANRVATTFQGCTQLYQLFVKSNGTVSCSCLRYWDISGGHAGNRCRGVLQRQDNAIHSRVLRGRL